MVKEDSCAEQSEETHEYLTVMVVNSVHVFVGGMLQGILSVIEVCDVLVDR